MKIMQCWDDGVANDVPLISLLKKYNAKATFNLNSGLHKQKERTRGWLYQERFRVDRLALDEMQDVYSEFKVAGHSRAHSWLTRLSPPELKTDLVECKAFIRDFFGQEQCGMAYPFGDYNFTVEQAVQDAGYLYARTVDDSDTELALANPMALHPHCHFMSQDFWNKYENVREADGIFYFWGHSYEMMDDEQLWAEFEEKLARISADSQAQWIDVIDLFSTKIHCICPTNPHMSRNTG